MKAIFETAPKVKEELKMVTKDNKVNEENLEKVLECIKSDAKKANKGNIAAARRFRLNTTAFGKVSMSMRKVTPKADPKD